MEPQRTPASPAELTPKVVELRNAREITRAAQYTEDELETHLQLGTADTDSKRLLVLSLLTVVKNIGLGQTNSELAKSIDEMLKTVGDLDQAALDLLAGAQAQLAELAAERESPQSATETSATAAALSEIDAELKRRQEMGAAVAKIQVEYEDERDTRQPQLEALRERLAIGGTAKDRADLRELEVQQAALIATITTVIEAFTENDRQVDVLKAYKNAVAFVNQGVPPGIIGAEVFKFRK